MLFVKDLIGLVGCFRYIIVTYNMIKRLNTIGILGIVGLLCDYDWCLRISLVSSSVLPVHTFARSTNCFVSRL